jgi:hypothetical protein
VGIYTDVNFFLLVLEAGKSKFKDLAFGVWEVRTALCFQDGTLLLWTCMVEEQKKMTLRGLAGRENNLPEVLFS